jgi:hypothetical protein
MVDHALAPHLGRVGGQHGHNAGVRQHLGHLRLVERRHYARNIRAVFARNPLPVLSQIGEQREQHEPAHEVQCIVEIQRTQPAINLMRALDATMPVDRGRTDIFDPPKQRLAAQFADHIAENTPEETDIGVLRDRV